MKIFISVCIFSILASVFIMPLRGGYLSIEGVVSGPDLSIIIGFVVFYLATSFLLNRYKDKLSVFLIIIALILGRIILDIPFRIFNFNDTLISLPDLFCHLLGIIAGGLSYRISKLHKIILFSCFFIFCFFIAFWGQQYWNNKLSFGTSTGKIQDISEYQISFQTKEGDTVSLQDFNEKYLVIDCWYTNCGECYKKFPQVEKLFNDYKDNRHIAIFALHCRIKGSEKKNESFNTGSTILKTKGYNLPCLSIDMEDPILIQLKVKVFPTILIFDQYRRLIYRGNIEGADKLIKKILIL